MVSASGELEASLVVDMWVRGITGPEEPQEPRKPEERKMGWPALRRRTGRTQHRRFRRRCCPRRRPLSRTHPSFPQVLSSPWADRRLHLHCNPTEGRQRRRQTPLSALPAFGARTA